MDEIAKDIAEYIQTVISYTIQTVASNLSSKNKDIYEAACNVLDTFMDVLGNFIIRFYLQSWNLFEDFV